MSNINIHIHYNDFSEAILQEFNERDIEIKSFNLKLKSLSVFKEGEFFVLKGEITSSIDASFKITLSPVFYPDTQVLDPQIQKMNFKTNNILFKAPLHLAKPIIKNNIENFAQEPISKFYPFLTDIIDEQINKSELPYNLTLNVQTKSLVVHEINFLESQINIQCTFDQEININSKSSV